MGRAACGLAFVVVLASCLEPPQLRGPASEAGRIGFRAASGPGGTQVAWINDGLRPIDQPRAVGAFAIGMVSGPDRTLMVVGLDPATGHVRWQQPLTPGAVPPGVQVQVTPIGQDKIAYLRPAGADTVYAELVLADAATGTDIAKTSPEYFNSLPYRCGNEEVCATAPRAGGPVVVHLDAAGSRELREANGAPQDARIIGNGGLFDLGDRPGNTLALVREGKIWWRTPISAAFPPGFSTDNGWIWRLYGDAHVFVGSVGAPAVHTAPNRITRDLANTATAGLSERDGSVIWRDVGSFYEVRLGGGRHPLRYRARGTVVLEEGVDVSFRDVNVTIESFDLTRGKTTWSVPLGADRSFVGGEVRLPLSGANEVVLQAPVGPIVLDFATGQTSPPAAGATFWCASDQSYELFPSYQTDQGKVEYTRRGGVLAVACDARAQPVAALPGAAATRAFGAQVGDYVLVAVRQGRAEGFVGFKLPPQPPNAPAPDVAFSGGGQAPSPATRGWPAAPPRQWSKSNEMNRREFMSKVAPKAWAPKSQPTNALDRHRNTRGRRSTIAFDRPVTYKMRRPARNVPTYCR
jgi:hypothetical protein